MSLADLQNLPAIAEKVTKTAASGRTVVVAGTTGAGRLSLLEPLRAALFAAGRSVVEIRLPPFDAFDAARHGLLQLAAWCGASELAAARDRTIPFEECARRLVRHSAKAGATLVVHVPETWSSGHRHARPGLALREKRAVELFRAWFQEPLAAGAAIVMHCRSTGLVDGLDVDRVELPAPKAHRAGLEDDTTWGSYAEAARAVLATKDIDFLEPIQLRLLVGIVALGGDPVATVATLWRGAGHLTPLLDEIETRLAEPRHMAVSDAVRRFLRARFPLPIPVSLGIAGGPEEHQPLLTQCLAYPQQGVLRVPDAVRARLSGPYRTNWNETHYALATHHRSEDGAPSPPADPTKVVHWLEKVHHLGRSGPLGAAEWDKVSPELGPEHLLDRARSLSVVDRDYCRAAELYRGYLHDAAEDAYAWHYLAFNLHRAGARIDQVESAYRRAIEIEPGNSWWNSRLVTLLIDDLRYEGAEAEWRDTIARLDPNKTRIERDASYPRHVHRWVVRAWLSVGEVARARAVFRTIPKRIVDQNPALIRLREEVEDAAESQELGESVYPAHIPVGRRWIAPTALPDLRDDLPLRTWLPGRVVAIEASTVGLVVALPGERRVFAMTVTGDEWRAWAGGTARIDTFFELGFYGDTNSVVEIRELKAVPAAPPLDDDDDDPHSLSHVA
jgi:hypothetical protein